MNDKFQNIILVIIVLIILIVGYFYFFNDNPSSQKIDTTLNVTGPAVVFIGDNDYFNVNTNSSSTSVIYKYGYLYSDHILFNEINPKIPFKAIKVGTEEVEVKSGDIKKNLNVLVCNKIKAKNKTISITIGSNYKFSFNIAKECLAKYDFYVADSSIASYDDSKIVGKKIGTTNLTISRGSEKYTYKIQVKPKELKFASTVSTINVGSSTKLSLSGVDGNLTCKSSNEKIFTVEVNNDACLVKPVSPGKAKVIASSGGKNAELTLEILQPVTSVAFKSSSYSVPKDSAVNAEVVINPSNASNKAFTCKSADSSIATASISGTSCLIKGIKIGNTEIIVTASGKTAKATVKIIDPVKIMNIRVASWNLARYNKPSIAVKTQAEFFKSKNVDIGGFQEVKNWDGSMTVPLNVYKSVTGYNYAYYDLPAGNAIVSKYAIKSTTKQALTSCKESRGVLKIVVNINGIDVSIYDTHFSYQSECFTAHTESLKNFLKNDPNPQIITGDFNGAGDNLLNNLGSEYEMLARDTIRNIYIDMVIIKAKDGSGKIRLKGNGYEPIQTSGVYTDHNMVIANIQVLN